MRLSLVTLVLLSHLTYGQQNCTSDVNSNSYECLYVRNGLTIDYDYNKDTEIHDYSGNWDLDGDNQPDSLLFVGNGGGHLYFNLRIVLTTNGHTYNFESLTTDMPFTGTFEGFYSSNTPIFPTFLVHDFDTDGISEIYFVNDNGFSTVPEIWRNKGVKSRYLLLNYTGNSFEIKDFNMKTRMKYLFGDIDETWVNTFWPEDLPSYIINKLDTLSSHKVLDFVIFTARNERDLFAIHPEGILYVKDDFSQFVHFYEVYKMQTICYAILINVLPTSIDPPNLYIQDFVIQCDDNNAVDSFKKVIEFGTDL